MNPSARRPRTPDDPTPIVIGVVGGIGAGKSAAARALEALGCAVVDSDENVRALLRTAPVVRTLREWWGDGVLDEAGAVDRAAVARVVFADPAQRARLEALLHPMLRAPRERAVADAARRGLPGVVLDAPLLFEAGVNEECDVVLFVDAPWEARVERVRSRGWTPDTLRDREKSQAPLEHKRNWADDVVRNDGDEQALRAEIAHLFERILRRFGRLPGPPG